MKNKKYIGKKEKKFSVKEKKSFVIVVPSYNNEKWVDKNLSSLFEQDYDNFRVIYINDASKDQTLRLVQKYIDGKNCKDKITLINNEKNQGAMANLYKAIHSCKDEEIVAIVDGDDWLYSKDVLKILNKYYQDPDIWLTYGQYVDYPSNSKGICRPFTKKSLKRKKGFRGHDLITSHLRTFYAGLFKEISLQDLTYKGKFLEVTYDVGIMMPMLEMAKDRFTYIDKILYYYNRDNPISDGNVRRPYQIEVDQYIRSLKPYPALKYLPYKRPKYDKKVDVVVFSFDRPIQLFSCLESIEKRVSDISNISVIYKYSEEKYKKCYQIVKDKFPNVQYFCENKLNKSFKDIVLNVSFNQKKQSKYILYCVDDIIVKDDTNIEKAIDVLEMTNAYGFYLRLGHHINESYAASKKCPPPHTIHIKDDIYAWRFDNQPEAQVEWAYPNSVDMILYRKEDIARTVTSLNFSKPNSFEGNWASFMPEKRIGLFYSTSKILNIPMNLVNTETPNRHMKISTYSAEGLNNKFQDGYKINIDTFKNMQNNAPHVEYNVEFIKR